MSLEIQARWPSKFDSNVEFSRDEWTVTVVVCRRNFHARLIFEGVTEGNKPFFQWVDFKPNCQRSSFWEGTKGEIESSRELEHANLSLDRYRKKTETWIRSREKLLYGEEESIGIE